MKSWGQIIWLKSTPGHCALQNSMLEARRRESRIGACRHMAVRSHSVLYHGKHESRYVHAGPSWRHVRVFPPDRYL